jgi:branched-chain amino acid transport system ATP-binding protein
MRKMLKLENVEVTYGGAITALRGVSAVVEEQSIIGLFGVNGAGKTTTLKAISGLLKTEEGSVTKGTIEFENVRIDKERPENIVKAGIVQVMEGRRIFEQLSVVDNLIAGAHLRSDRAGVKRDLEVIYNDYFPALRPLYNKVSGYLSGGEQQMLVIARALMARPRIMLLDEPSLGLAPLVVKHILGIIKRIRDEQQNSILLVEQNVKAGLSIVDYGYVLENGRTVLEGESGILEGNPSVREFYLHGAGEKAMNYKSASSYQKRESWLSRIRLG